MTTARFPSASAPVRPALRRSTPPPCSHRFATPSKATRPWHMTCTVLSSLLLDPAIALTTARVAYRLCMAATPTGATARRTASLGGGAAGVAALLASEAAVQLTTASTAPTSLQDPSRRPSTRPRTAKARHLFSRGITARTTSRGGIATARTTLLAHLRCSLLRHRWPSAVSRTLRPSTGASRDDGPPPPV